MDLGTGDKAGDWDKAKGRARSGKALGRESEEGKCFKVSPAFPGEGFQGRSLRKASPEGPKEGTGASRKDRGTEALPAAPLADWVPGRRQGWCGWCGEGAFLCRPEAKPGTGPEKFIITVARGQLLGE